MVEAGEGVLAIYLVAGGTELGVEAVEGVSASFLVVEAGMEEAVGEDTCPFRASENDGGRGGEEVPKF